MSVCVSMCLSVRVFVHPCVHFLRYRLNVFLLPLFSPFLEIQNPWQKVVERSGLRFDICSKMVYNRLSDFLKNLLTFEVLFKRLFAPPSRSWMSKIVKDSESLGKSNGKKWSQMSSFLLKNGLKGLRRQKSFFFLFWIFFPFFHSI